jgi:uncharacterized membrane protein YdjX (TVP38/TMEM64 family)
VASWCAARYYAVDADLLLKVFGHLPIALAAVGYILLYVAVTFFIFFSKDIFWFTGALLFGPFVSSLCIYAAECSNACVLWYCARYLGGRGAWRAPGQKYARLAGKIKGISFAWLFLLRATPLVPYRFLDLAAGACGIPLGRYMAAVILGSWLKIFWVQYMLAAVGKAALTDPGAVAEYYVQHPTLLWTSTAYLAVVGLAALKFRKK